MAYDVKFSISPDSFVELRSFLSKKIDDDAKTAYVYSDYKSEIDNFRMLICSAEKLLESDDLEYKFKEYSTANRY